MTQYKPDDLNQKEITQLRRMIENSHVGYFLLGTESVSYESAISLAKKRLVRRLPQSWVCSKIYPKCRVREQGKRLWAEYKEQA